MTRRLIDVRTKAEYRAEHAAGSENISLIQLLKMRKKLKQEPNLILLCASGARSGTAKLILSFFGVKCNNGGSYKNFMS